MIKTMCALQDQIVAALVRPVIGLAITYKKNSRMIGLHIFQHRHLEKGIENVVGIEAGCGLVQLV